MAAGGKGGSGGTANATGGQIGTGGAAGSPATGTGGVLGAIGSDSGICSTTVTCPTDGAFREPLTLLAVARDSGS